MENMRFCVNCSLSSLCCGKLPSMFEFSCRKPMELAHVTSVWCCMCHSSKQSYFLFLSLYIHLIKQFCMCTTWSFCSSLPSLNWQQHMQDIIKILARFLPNYNSYGWLYSWEESFMMLPRAKKTHLKIHAWCSHRCFSLHVILSRTHVLPLLCWPKSIWGKKLW